MKTASHQTGVVWMAAVVDFVVLPAANASQRCRHDLLIN